jgi:hypothetical protein
MDQAHRILAGGPVYQQFQITGPYQMTDRPELYPPTTIFGLFLPLSLLPDPAWWIIPLGTLAAVTLWHRPGIWAWLSIELCLAWPNTGVVIVAGNPVIWAAAALALGTVWRWPSVLVLLKPSLFPFALFGIRSRRWWIALAIFGIASLAMLPLWLDYLTVLRNGRLDLLYSVGHVPLMLIPLLAWLGRRPKPPGASTRVAIGQLSDRHPS